MTRLTLSDMVQIQADTIGRYEILFAKVLDALTARPEPRTASETIKLARGATGDHTTGVAVEVVVQDGETLEQARARASSSFEQLAARYPLPSGAAHPAPLGKETKT
jgi:hypothetical protein